MPYNVISFTCTVLALCFGSLLNALRRRIGEEESKFKKAAARLALIPLLLARLRCQRVDLSKSESSPASPARLKLLLKVVFVELFCFIICQTVENTLELVIDHGDVSYLSFVACGVFYL